MTRLLVVLLLLLPLALSEKAYADEDVKYCSAFDARIEVIRGQIAEEEAKDNIDFFWLKTRWGRLEHFLELKVSCLESTVESYRETAKMFYDQCENK